jgi:hypothetical protein
VTALGWQPEHRGCAAGLTGSTAEVAVSPSTRSKAAGAIAGTAGTGSLVTAVMIVRMTSVDPVPTAAWVATTALAAVSALIGCLALVLDYRLRLLSVRIEGSQAQASTDLEKSRLESYQAVLAKAAGEPGRAAEFRELITADAMHLSVERGGPPPAGLAASVLPGPRPATGAARRGTGAPGRDDRPGPGLTECRGDVTERHVIRH